MATITDILISELDRAVVPATGDDELVINQLDGNSGDFITRRINWTEIGQSIKDLSGDPNNNNGLTNQVMFGDGTESDPSITFKSDTSTGIYKPQLNLPTVAFTSGGLEVLRAVDVTSTSRFVGIGFANSDPEIPQDSLHVKGGGIKIQFSDSNNATNVLHFKLATDGPSIDTTKSVPLIFAVNNLECGRWSAVGNFHMYRSLGVGDIVAGTPSVNYGDDGDILLSQGINNSLNWSSPADFFLENTEIITEILINDPDFIDGISSEIDIEIINNNIQDLNIAEGLGVVNYPNGYPANVGDPGDYIYATFIFNHLPTIQ